MYTFPLVLGRSRSGIDALYLLFDLVVHDYLQVLLYIGPVSYTHLDVYKRQPAKPVICLQLTKAGLYGILRDR